MHPSLLAIETTGKSGSVALRIASQPEALHADALDPQHGSARTLVPAIAALLERCGRTPSQLDAVAVISGPGSFTGLRVGIATAKSLAYALHIPVVAVDGLDVIAWQLAPERVCDAPRADRLLAVVDAYRGQMFGAEFRLETSGWRRIQPTCVLDYEAVFEQIVAPKSGDCLVAGPGADKLRKAWESQPREACGVRWHWYSGEAAMPHASSVAHLGWQRWLEGKTEDLWGLSPQYYRSSAAEEQRAKG